MRGIYHVVVGCVLLNVIVGCHSGKRDEATDAANRAPIKLNEIQVVGSHNSYKREIQPEVLALIASVNEQEARSLEYRHRPLTEQLGMGLRNLELDVVYDPHGGRYASPYANRYLREKGIEPWPYDTTVMQQPGFKVLHIPDLDFRSWCPLFVDGLKQLKQWSDAHPNHLPVIITMNAKSGGYEGSQFVPVLPFTTAAYDSLDAEITSVLSRNDLIVPDDVRGDYPTLNEAVLAGNWPLLDSVRGRFLFVLDERVDKYTPYLVGHEGLVNRVMFVRAEPGESISAFLIQNEPIQDKERIKEWVRQGYMVRTRADAGTEEARKGDYTRLQAATESGAQVITTDYYMPEERFATGYAVTLPNKRMTRYNPILHPDLGEVAIEERGVK